MMSISNLFGRKRVALLLVAAILILVGAGVLGAASAALADQERANSHEGRPVDAVSRWDDATPEERREMREMARLRWESASPRERRAYRRGMYALGRVLPDFSLIERRVLLRRFIALPKAERESLRRRLRKIDDLEPKERRKFADELRGMLNESPGEAARIERNLDRWRRMSESEREKYREQMRRFRAMSAEDRRKLLDQWADPESE